MIYLASPYSHPNPARIRMRFEAARFATASLLLQGLTVYSPIVHGHAIASAHDLPADFEWWMRHCIDMLSRAGDLYVLKLDGWEESRGVKAEIDWWNSNRESTPHYIDPIGLPLPENANVRTASA